MSMTLQLNAQPTEVADVLAFLNEKQIAYSITSDAAPAESVVRHVMPEHLEQLIYKFNLSVQALTEMSSERLTSGMSPAQVEVLGNITTQLSQAAELVSQATSPSRLEAIQEVARSLASSASRIHGW
jgi:hypothetical protein